MFEYFFLFIVELRDSVLFYICCFVIGVGGLFWSIVVKESWGVVWYKWEGGIYYNVNFKKLSKKFNNILFKGKIKNLIINM